MDCLIAIGSSIVGEIANHTVVPVGRQLGYLLFYKSNLETFRKQIKDLEHVRNSMQRRVEEARRNCEEIEDDVKDWLGEVEKISQDADDFLGTDAQADTRCSDRRPFPNLVLRYQLSRKAKKMASEVECIIKMVREFDGISYRPTLSYIQNSGYEVFDTRTEKLKQVMEVLRDSNISRVGVHGMPGVGKTMFVKEAAIQAKKEDLFSLAVMAVVSQTPNVGKIQQEIAEQLGLELGGERSIPGRACLLRFRLKQENKILIILDDVWKKLDLQEIGLCFEDHQKGCKILFTSRDRQVLNSLMGAENIFFLKNLPDNEARKLFNKIVGGRIEKPGFRPLASKLVSECAGLPVAITTVAHALKDGSLSVWKDALRQLQSSDFTNIEGMDEEVYKSILLSYNFLGRDEEAKLLLLFCSLHAEDEEISVENLVRYGVSWGLFDSIDTLEKARDRVRSLVDKLKYRCLLLGGHDHDLVKMHDVIRDVMVSIASKDRGMHTLTNVAKLNDKSLRDSTAIFLPSCESDQLPERLDCPKLKLFFMFNLKQSSLLIPEHFFGEAKELQVLFLTSLRLDMVLSSFTYLQNLQMLIFHNCELGGIALLGKLKNLKVLDLSWSNFEQFPKEIGQLAQLRLLSLEYCPNLLVIPFETILSLKHLEELNIGEAFVDWKIKGVQREISNSCLTDLSLSKLSNLRFRIRADASVEPNDLFTDRIEFQQLRSLALQYSQTCSRSDSSVLLFNEKVAFPSLEVLKLSEIDLNKLWMDRLPTMYFRNLRCLSVRRCNNLKYLLNFAVFRSLATLEFLKIRECRDMEEVLFAKEPSSDKKEGRFQRILFSQLKYLELWDLPNLKRFWAGNFIECPCLLKLTIKYCPKLKTFITFNNRNNN
ncbi:hypothetical protein TIFTF001_016334 [Ficus carica]|uniref:AAA+ ATPase domain-containing protein n=1 Tax=Ficus carica TaxID=3494 RepID=A0AA88ANF7_FICCA|nr:hypothetical protein TIFTF001_016334 [Ficus carica]